MAFGETFLVAKESRNVVRKGKFELGPECYIIFGIFLKFNFLSYRI